MDDEGDQVAGEGDRAAGPAGLDIGIRPLDPRTFESGLGRCVTVGIRSGPGVAPGHSARDVDASRREAGHSA